MPHGTPDWADTGPTATIHRVTDIGELAVREGNLASVDRLGNVVWMTDFRYGLQGSSFGSDHADSKGALSTNRAVCGPFSIKLDPRGAADAYVNWRRVIHFLPTGKIGLETILSLDTDPYRVAFILYYCRGTDYLQGFLEYNPTTGEWKIFTAGAIWETVLTGVTLQQGAEAWHQVKLVIDAEEEEYVRAVVDKYPLDLSDYDLYQGAAAVLGQLEARITCHGSVDKSEAIFVGGVIVTQNED